MLFARAVSRGARRFTPDVFIVGAYNEADEIDAPPVINVDNSGIESLRTAPISAVEVPLPAVKVQAEIVEAPAPVTSEEKPVATAEDIKVILDTIMSCKTKEDLEETREVYKGAFKYTPAHIAAMRKAANEKEKELSDG